MSIATFNKVVAEMKKEFKFDDDAKFRIIGDARTTCQVLEITYVTNNGTRVVLSRPVNNKGE